ncbi:hypothetical protein A0J61_05848 [Choanephora cucurbitarum]|uniref:Uncharacterized protein n=1 Tax=Choanephora cucurbitarum TaxID=101091 RepID=A0A1C7NAV8_9FUNG|nr:hypothetical protein A0J61_05848 [Choanephora cucurbitarum]
MSISKNRASQYSRLIRLTPNVKTLRAKANDESLFQTVLLEMQKGHWKQLYRILEENLSNNWKVSLCHDYYTLISTIQDKLVFVMLNIPSDPNLLDQPSCFRLPSRITKQTRFNAAETVLCSSRGKTEIKVLEDALALCPNAVCVVLSHTSLDWYEDGTRNFEPNTTVKGLSVTLGEYTEGSLDYICHKFPDVEELVIGVSIDSESDFCISEDIAVQLADFAYRTNKCYVSLEVVEGHEQWLPAFISHEWAGELNIFLQEHCFCFRHDKSKPRLSTLHIEGDIEYLEDLSESVEAYFRQLDELDINQGGRSCDRLLEYCPQLRRTRNGYCYVRSTMI